MRCAHGGPRRTSETISLSTQVAEATVSACMTARYRGRRTVNQGCCLWGRQSHFGRLLRPRDRLPTPLPFATRNCEQILVGSFQCTPGGGFVRGGSASLP